MPIEIKILTNEDGAVLDHLQPGVFDDTLDPRATREFLADPRHHLAVAREAERVIGVASAVHYVHPDKPLPELWINEIGVAPTHRGRGVGKALLRALTERGSALGCCEAWVLTDRGNEAAMQLYRSSGGVESMTDQVLFTFRVNRLDA